MPSDYVARTFATGIVLAAAAYAQQPANTAVWVANERALNLVQVAGGVAAPFGSPPSCAGCFNYDVARDAATGNFVVAAGTQLTIYPPTGGAASAVITVKQLAGLNPSLFAYTPALVSVAVNADGNYIVADNANNQVLKITPTSVTRIASFNSYIFNPYGGDAFVRLDSSGNYILAIDNSNSYLVGSARPGHSRRSADRGKFKPDDSDGDGPTLYVLRIPAGSVSVNCEPSLGPTACESTSVAPANDFVPSTVGGLTLDAGGNFVITDWYDDFIFTISASGGGSTGILDGAAAMLMDPLGIYYDPPSGYFFLVDDINNALYSLGPSGCQTNCLKTILTGGALAAPISLVAGALAPASGPAPSITPGGVVPIYSTSTTIQPGEWVSIYGSNFASATALWNGDFPTFLGGISVTINLKPAYLWLVSPEQINLQTPDDTATGTVPVTVTTAGGTATSTVTLAQFGPSFSLLDAKHVAGIILRSDGSGAYGGGTYDIIGPTGTSLGYPTVAAKAGDPIELFGVGFGPTIPPVLAGQAYSGAAGTTNPVTLFINNVSVTPPFAGLSSAGLYQINLTVPAGLGTRDVPVLATVGGMQTPSGVVISLQ
jgi:uncharacterized protein (TIGR03437 family)